MQILGYQVTYKQTDHDCNKGTIHSDTLRFPSVATMPLRRNVLQEDDILCELYADTRSDVCDVVTSCNNGLVEICTSRIQSN